MYRKNILRSIYPISLQECDATITRDDSMSKMHSSFFVPSFVSSCNWSMLHTSSIGLLLAYGIIVSLQGNDSPNSWNTQNISKYVVVLLKDEIRISKYINNTSLSHWKNNKCVKINVVKILSQACLNGNWVGIAFVFRSLMQ